MSPSDPERALLDYGNEAVEDPLEAVLDDGVTASPFREGGRKKGKKKKNKCEKRARGKTLIIVSGGYSYTDEATEVSAIEHDSWMPSTADFEAAVKADDGTPLRARNPSEFFKHIADQPTGSVGRVVFVGHGHTNGLLFAGDPAGFGAVAGLYESTLSEFQADIESKLKPKLHPNAKIVLVTCNTGGGQAFIDALVNAFDRCVRGFDSAIEYRNPTVTDEKTITDRGLTRSDPGKGYAEGWKHLGPNVQAYP